ncbi:MAG TPA: hypothetical protein VLX56_00945 [Nitrososphaerales archaeon]|nr:hypothetical protein [Nitrososphaerales archaeon]
MAESSDARQGAAASTAAANTSDNTQKFWEFADLGFDTGKRLWFLQFYNGRNENVGTYFANSVSLAGGRAAQYEWKDSQGGPFWHVRERFFAAEIEKFSIDPTGGTIKLNFRGEQEQEEDTAAPAEFAYLVYAYHLTSKDGGRAPLGFVEFYDSKGGLIQRVDNRWILIEDLDRRTSGEFPHIRLRVEGDAVGRVIVTPTAIIIQGKRAGKQAPPEP